MTWSPSSYCIPKRWHLWPQQVDRGHHNGHWQQDLQQNHVWTNIQDDQQTWREMPIWIHSWIWMSIWYIHDQKTSTFKTQPQPPNMGGIHRPSQGLRHLQPCITHCHTRKIWRTSKTMISNQMHVRQNNSQAHHRKYWDIHWLQSGCQTRIQRVIGAFSVPDYVLRRDTRRQLDGPEIKQSPIFM